MVPWSSFRNYGNSRKGIGRSCGALTAVILGLMCVTVQGAAFHSAQRCGGNWTRHNGKPFVTPGSTDEKQDEIGIRALLEQFLSTHPESKRSMVRAAMGFDEVVHVAPKQVTLKELTAKHAEVEKRQEDMAKRIIDTRKNWIRSQKSWRSCQWRNARSRQSLRREPQISRFWKQRGVTPQRRQPWRSNSLHRTISRGIRRNSGLINSRKPTRQSELHKSWQHTSLPSVGVQQRLSNQNTSMSSPSDPIQGPFQTSQVGEMGPPDIKNLIAHADRTAGLANEAASRAFREEATPQAA